MAGRIPSRGSDQFVIRFPDGMREQIRSAADKHGRSMNAEIIDRLEQSFEIEETIPRADVALTRIESALAELKQTAFEREQSAHFREEMLMTVLKVIANNGGKVPPEMAPLLQKLAGPIEGNTGGE